MCVCELVILMGLQYISMQRGVSTVIDLWGCLHDDSYVGVSAAKVEQQGRGASDGNHPDRKSKRSIQGRSWEKKVQFHQPNYLGDGRGKI